MGQAPERKVEGNVITSARDPAMRIRLPGSLQYLGADRWVLYDVADCELHVFVEADAQKNVRRLYWVQFEGYVPTRPELQYAYDSPRHVTMAGRDFFVDTWVRTTPAKTRPGSDGEHVRTLLREHGYKLPDGMMSVRLVHLLDEQKRKELMIIYGEDVATTGYSASELAEGGKARDRWAAIDSALIERATSQIAID